MQFHLLDPGERGVFIPHPLGNPPFLLFCFSFTAEGSTFTPSFLFMFTSWYLTLESPNQYIKHFSSYNNNLVSKVLEPRENAQSSLLSLHFHTLVLCHHHTGFESNRSGQNQNKIIFSNFPLCCKTQQPNRCQTATQLADSLIPRVSGGCFFQF